MGTSYIWHCINNGKQDHPHAYGDKTKIKVDTLMREGSSPRVWGQVLTGNFCKNIIRIIPTRMGTRDGMSEYAMLKEDHPHAYGDKSCTANSSCIESGSSPRVWGQELYLSINRLLRGIIPTRMGTSSVEHQLPQISQDHPHAYGDKSFSLLQRLPFSGSSPRVWGQASQDYRVSL